MQAKGVTFIHPDIRKQSNVEFFVDPLRIKQIIMNLLNNAYKFTPSGGTVELAIKNICHDGQYAVDRITIRDTGCGMSRSFLEYGLYKPFSQEQNEFSATLNGTGLGLALVKEIVEKMEGQIDVSSELHKGTTFVVALRYEYRIPNGKQAEPEKASDLSILHGKHVLLVDDHPLNRKIAKTLLEKVGMIVDQAEDGSIAVNRFSLSESGYYCAIIMDIRMPVMDGLTASGRIRAMKREDAATIPIIAMTANAFDEDIKKSRAAGMDTHLAKPVAPQLLYETLAQAINRLGK